MRMLGRHRAIWGRKKAHKKREETVRVGVGRLREWWLAKQETEEDDAVFSNGCDGLDWP
jgi:hypothetical protein